MLEPQIHNMIIGYCVDKIKQIKTIQQQPVVAQEQAPDPSPDNLKLIVDAKDLWAEIRPKLESTDFFSIMISGMQGSGKTNDAKGIYEEAEKDGYHPIYLSSFDMLDMHAYAVSQAQGHDKLFIVLDDISYTLSSISQKQASKLKNFVAMIRHALKSEGKTPKVCIVVIGHFTTAVPPMLKNTNYWIFSAPTNLEEETMYKIVGRSARNRQQLQSMFKAVQEIQKVAKPGKTLQLKITSGHTYQFTWDVDGRLQLILMNGQAMIYHTKRTTSPQCEIIGKEINVNPENYKMQEEKQ